MRFLSTGPAREGCHDLPEIVPAEFHRLGGEDIQVWDGTDYILDVTDRAALDYAVRVLGLENVSEGVEE